MLADGPEVSAHDIEEHVFGQRRTAATGGLPTLSLPELETMAIRAAMARFDGNKPRAAAALGIALKTLYNKLNALDAARDEPPAG